MNIQDFVICDTETTGFDAEKDQIVDVALVGFNEQGALELLYESLIKPTIPIPVTASAVHHITDADVQDARLPLIVGIDVKNLLNGKTLVAHNAEFDRKFMLQLGITNPPWDWLCTWRLANHLWPDAPGYKNQELRYWRGYANVDLKGMSPHRAAPDALVTAYLFRDLFVAFRDKWATPNGTAATPITQDLIEFAARPILIKKMPFGKHKGELIENVPDDYIMWMLRKIPDLSPDLKYTLKRHMGIS